MKKGAPHPDSKPPVHKVQHSDTYKVSQYGSEKMNVVGERSKPLSRVFNDQPRDIFIWPMSDRMYVSNTHAHVRMSV